MLRAFERGVHRRIARLDEADDIFDHHDGVIDHEAGRNRQRHERKVVQTETRELHHAERGDQRERQRDARNDRGPKFPEEYEDDHHDQRDGEQQRELHIRDGRANGFRAVAKDGQLYRRGQRGAKLGKQRFHEVGGLDDVRAGLALDVEQHGRIAADPARQADVFDVVHRFADVRHANGRTVPVGDDDVAIIGAGKNLVIDVDGIGLARAVEAAFGRVDAALNQCRANVLQAQTQRRECGGIQAHAHGRFLISLDGHEANPADFAEFLREHGVREVVDIFQRQRVRREREREDGSVGGVDFVVGRRVGHALRQHATRGVDGGLHVLRCGVNIAVECELQRDGRVGERTHGGHCGQPADLAELSFERGGDGGGHHVRARAGVLRNDLDGREIHRRQRGNRQEIIAEQAHQQHADHEQ